MSHRWSGCVFRIRVGGRLSAYRFGELDPVRYPEATADKAAPHTAVLQGQLSRRGTMTMTASKASQLTLPNYPRPYISNLTTFRIRFHLQHSIESIWRTMMTISLTTMKKRFVENACTS